MTFVMALVKLAALLTIRQQRWLTRDVEVSARTGRIQRTGGAHRAGIPRTEPSS
jgi:hypothetical protein